MRTEYDDVIRAWLDGAEVEQMHPVATSGIWAPFDGIWLMGPLSEWQYRLAKPEREPKYLYAYLNTETNTVEYSYKSRRLYGSKYKALGKIRLEE